MNRALTLFVVIAATVTLSAQDAQNVAKGFAVDKSYQMNDADSINTFNGNLNVALPLGPRFNVSSALSYQLYLTYGGNVWDFDGTDVSVQIPGDNHLEDIHVEWAYVDPKAYNAGVGWNLSLGRFADDTYYGADGAEHVFYSQLHDEEAVSGTSYTRDGSYLRATMSGDETTVEFPDGTYQKFEEGRLVSINDRFENAVTITYTPGSDGALDWEIHDGSRIHLVDFRRVSGSQDSGVSYTYDVVQSVKFDSATPATPPQIDFAYVGGSSVLSGLSRQLAIDQDCRKSGVALAPVLESVTLVDRSKYEMTTDRGDATQQPDGSWTGTFASFDGTGSSRNCSAGVTLAVNSAPSFSGHLTQLKHPTGARTVWAYQAYKFPARFGSSSSAQCVDVSNCHIAASTQAAVGVKERFDYDRSSNKKTMRTYDHGPVDTATRATTLKTYIKDPATTAWNPVSQSIHYYNTPFNENDDRPSYGLPFTRYSPAAPSGQANPDSGGRYLSSKLLDGAGKLLRYNYVSYETEDPMRTYDNSGNRRMKSERVVQLDGDEDVVSDVVTTSSDFDGFGHYRTTTTTTSRPPEDLADVLPLTIRTVKTRYNESDDQVDSTAPVTGTFPGSSFVWPTTDHWILNTYSSQTTQETVNGATKTTKDLFLFNRSTGFLERRRVLKNIVSGTGAPALDPNDILSVFTEDGGNVGTESHYGGDGQSMDYELPLGSMPLPSSPVMQITQTYAYGSLKTSRYTGISYPFVNRTIDLHTGLTTKSVDPAGVETSFEYNPSGRLIWSEAILDDTHRVVTAYAYTPPSSTVRASVTIQQRDGARNGTILTTATVDYDDFGRVWREKRTMPSNMVSTRETLYDERGFVRSVSEWNTSSNLGKVTAYTYDALGRVLTAAPPDDSVTKFSYVGGRSTTRQSLVATAIDDPGTTDDDFGTAQETVETTDDLGRLVQVEEPGGTVTRYGYDVGGHLASVRMTAPSVLQAVEDAQGRTFTYDGRGFLQSETHPESGETTYEYDARGHVTERTAAGATTVTFEYDPAERLTRVAEGANTLKSFTFDRANNDTVDDKSMGKLASAVRHNYGTPHGDLIVTETFRYQQPGGRLSAKETTLSHTGQTFTEFYDYDTLGGVTGLTYPTCASCTFPSREITNQYAKGLLTGVIGYTTSGGITYSNNGMVGSVRHLNDGGTSGPLDTQTYDTSNGMARPLAITFSNFCDDLKFTSSPQSQTVTSGQSANLSVSATSATTYQWFEQRADGTSVAVSGQTSQVMDLTMSSTRQFWVRAGNGTCTVDSSVATVTVNNCTLPNVNITAPSTMNRNATAQAYVSAASDPSALYEWTVTGGDVTAGAGTRTITFRAHCSSSMVTVKVKVTSFDCYDTGTTTITTGQVAAAMLSVVPPSTVPWKTTKSLNVALTGIPGWSGTWSDGTPWSDNAGSFGREETLTKTTTYSLSGTDSAGCSFTSNSLTIAVTPPTPVVTASAISATQVQLSWTVPSGFTADVYDVERSTSGNAFTTAGSTTTATSWSGTASANAAYLYRVRAKKGPTYSAWSNLELATTVLFADDPVVSFSTTMLEQHISQLRTAVNAVRALAGLPAASFTDAAGVAQLQPKTVHVQELRNALVSARSNLGLPAVIFTDPTLVSGGFFKAVYVNQLRGGVQ